MQHVKHFWRSSLAVSMFVVTVMSLFVFATTVQASGSGCGTWKVVASPTTTFSSSTLRGVKAFSSSSVWAVGYGVTSAGLSQTLTERWNGTGWSVVASPNVGTHGNSLTGVTGVSSSDIWAVGGYVVFPQPQVGVFQTLIEHWNGTSWSVVASPNVGSADNTLTSVAAVSANNVWAVGYAGGQTLVEHWNGTSWSVVSSPNPPTSPNYLYSVTAISANDVWAVGDSIDGVRAGSTTLTEHWNGTSWSIVASPNVGTLGSYLHGVAATSSSNVLSVGHYDQIYGSPTPTLAERWNGTGWSVVSSASPSAGTNVLSGVTALSSTNAWSVGNTYNSGLGQTLIEHWNGTSWSAVSSPNSGIYSNTLFAVSASASNNVWAVGEAGAQTLIESYC